MAKRRAEDVSMHDSPSKRCSRSLWNVDRRLQSAAAAPIVSGNLKPPSLLAVLGSRCRKRPYCFEEPPSEETAARPCSKSPHCDTRKPAGTACGNVQDRRSSDTLTNPKKGPRDEDAGSEAALVKATEQTDADSNAEDCTYNSFQYWRVPLPELDLSLLEDANDHSQTEGKADQRHYFDAMKN
ncbi:hypothetical protein Q5P01_014739 [Channa striata]|uniref:Putative WW-binding domain-containing protein n=1 Tax=Channa striata TaxID=64152 RepID=A0AA88MJ69_CHASR|nr:hypothetical protein Q5P01_014739 [Channa striata]